MSERKVNLEEILNNTIDLSSYTLQFRNSIKKAMKEACRQTLELAAENAKICTDTMCSPYYEDWVKYIDKQSILDTIKQVE